MIGQYLSNNNEKATVPILQKNLHPNQPKVMKCAVRAQQIMDSEREFFIADDYL
jgi:hypothetical protein